MFPVGFILLRVDTCVYTQVAFIELFLQLWDSKIEGEEEILCVVSKIRYGSRTWWKKVSKYSREITLF